MHSYLQIGPNKQGVEWMQNPQNLFENSVGFLQTVVSLPLSLLTINWIKVRKAVGRK
jgi:hypothetical protein